eukprot:GHRR01028314.1.p1 GENE.GHRR01028314.1~~GHRR01028314.1.p1  ORF type:complete len:327 (+),score=74.41 GHRR01028314.1:349-1329(+)
MYQLGDEEDQEDRILVHGFDRIEQRSQARYQLQQRKKRLTYVMGAAALLITVVIIVSLSVKLTRKAQLPWTCKDEQGAQYDITFFVVGDWGRQGNANQQKAAQMMADVAECMQPAFIVSTGDNFYSHGLKSADDPLIQESFQKVYHQPSLQINWYATLGNHDYGDGIDPYQNSCANDKLEHCPKDCCYSPVWQYTGTFNDVRWHCQNGSWTVPTGSNGLLDIVMIDTNPFLQEYKAKAWYNNAAGIWEQNPEAIKQAMRRQLAASKATWKLVVGHHPIASYGHHCEFGMEKDCKDMLWLEQELQVLTECEHAMGHLVNGHGYKAYR